MIRTALTALAVVFAATSIAGAAPVDKSKIKRLAIFDQQTGEKVFDDGKLDGLGCVVGKRAVFDKETGQIKTVPAVKCNFDN